MYPTDTFSNQLDFVIYKIHLTLGCFATDIEIKHHVAMHLEYGWIFVPVSSVCPIAPLIGVAKGGSSAWSVSISTPHFWLHPTTIPTLTPNFFRHFIQHFLYTSNEKRKEK